MYSWLNRKWWNLRVPSWLLRKPQMCNTSVDNYAHALEFVPDHHKTQKMCNKAIDTSPSAMQFIPDWCKAEEICDIVVSKDPVMLKYCLGKFKAQ